MVFINIGDMTLTSNIIYNNFYFLRFGSPFSDIPYNFRRYLMIFDDI